MSEQIDKATAIRLLLTRWYRDFNEPVPYPTEMDKDVGDMKRKDFSLEVISAGIKRYRDTYMYGRTRNWAHLMQCCMEVSKASIKLMPAGMAADLFMREMATGYVEAARTDMRFFAPRVKAAGYGETTAIYIAAAHRRCGDSIRYDDMKFALRKFIKVYDGVVAEEIMLPPIPALEPGMKSIKELTHGEIAEGITRLHDTPLDSPTDEGSQG